MAPGPSSSWNFLMRILKASRHKAARSLKAADKAEEIDTSTERPPPKVLAKRTVKGRYSLNTPQKQILSDSSSNRSQLVWPSVLQALGFLSVIDHDSSHYQPPPAYLSIRHTAQVPQRKPWLLLTLECKSYRSGHFKLQTWYLRTRANLRHFPPERLVFSVEPVLTSLESSLPQVSELVGTSVDSPHSYRSEISLLDPTNRGSQTTSSTESANSTSCLQQLPQSLVDGDKDIETDSLPSRHSSISSTTSSNLFDGPGGEASDDVFGLEMVVTGKELHSTSSIREENIIMTIPDVNPPDQRTLLQPDIKIF